MVFQYAACDYLFTGPPQSGKSSLLRYISGRLDADLHPDSKGTFKEVHVCLCVYECVCVFVWYDSLSSGMFLLAEVSLLIMNMTVIQTLQMTIQKRKTISRPSSAYAKTELATALCMHESTTVLIIHTHT